MKQELKKANISVPEFAAVDSVIDIILFIEKHGYPVVIKPRRGYGSVNTTLIMSEKDLKQFLETLEISLNNFEIEKYIDGEMYHIDGLFYNRKLQFLWPSKYVNTVMNFKKNTFIAGYSLDPKNKLVSRLQQFVTDALVALNGPKTYPFHAEVWHTKDDKLVFCEVACRTGGGGIPNQIKELFGIDLHKIHAKAQCDIESTDGNMWFPKWIIQLDGYSCIPD